MTEVIELFKTTEPLEGSLLQTTRQEFGLSLVQASRILGISAPTLEKYETRSGLRMTISDVRNKFEYFVSTTDENVGKNLIFHHLPLRVAREIMGYSVEEIATKYDYSGGTWRKFECNQRELPNDVLVRLQIDVKQTFDKMCE